MGHQTKDGNATGSGNASTNSIGISSNILSGLPSVVSRNNNVVGNSAVGGIKGATASSSSTYNSLDDIFGNVIGRLKENMHTPEFSVIEERIDKFIADVVTPFLSQNLYAMGAGLFLGAAVISGLMVGTALSAGILYHRYYNTRQHSLTLPSSLSGEQSSAVQEGLTPDAKQVEIVSSEGSKETETNKINKTVDSLSVALGPVMLHFIRGTIKIGQSSSVSEDVLAATQCRECLESIDFSLKNKNLTWSDVKKLTVYMVAGKCDVVSFEAAQMEYPIPKDHMLTTILFVQRLEIPSAFVQIEAVATSFQQIM
jgi:enamine deaminase RidA (YjgF/YER057c/UK114 family)